MDNKQRYKELMKENDQILSYLSDSYQRIGSAYLKKARGYAVKSIDTELQIKKTLEELTSFDEKHIEQSIAIPNMTNYIEENVRKLSKAPTHRYKIKEIIAVTIFILVIAGYFVANCYLNKKKPIASPANVVVTVLPSDQRFQLFWDNDENATNGYHIVIYRDDEEIFARDVKKNVDTVTSKQFYISDVIYEEGKQYRFEITVKETTYFKESAPTIINYPE